MDLMIIEISRKTEQSNLKLNSHRGILHCKSLNDLMIREVNLIAEQRNFV